MADLAIPSMAAGFFSLLGNIEKGTGDTLNLPEGMVNIGGNGYGYLLAAQNNWDPTAVGHHDDTFSALAVGDDIYIYAVQDASGTAQWVATKNSTYPNGYSAANSRKIGGFHFGRVRVVNSDGVPIDAGTSTPYGAGWESNVVDGAILPNAVWDLANRPACDPTGMAKVDATTWADIYLVSAAVAVSRSGSKLASGLGHSACNATPLTGTEYLHMYNFVELAQRQGKRLLTLAEWLQAAEGSPQGNDADNNNAWSATTNSGRTTTGAVANAVSAKGFVDCAGNVFEWTNEFLTKEDPTNLALGWYDVMVGQTVGQLYMQHSASLLAVCVGGSWNAGVKAGSRTVDLRSYPWNVSADLGARFACDAL